MGCGTTAVKISSIVFNVLFGLLGLATIIYVALNHESFEEEAGISAYIIGTVIIIIAVLGSVAAIKESVCLITTYAIILLILAILTIVGTCLDHNERKANTGLEAVNKAWDDPIAMDAMQISHKCCGKDSAQDYIILNRGIPASCFESQDASNLEGLFKEGCGIKQRESSDSEKTAFIVVASLLIIFELLGFLLAVFLIINFRNKQRRLEF